MTTDRNWRKSDVQINDQNDQKEDRQRYKCCNVIFTKTLGTQLFTFGIHD
jgi:hypothetical protein